MVALSQNLIHLLPVDVQEGLETHTVETEIWDKDLSFVHLQRSTGSVSNRVYRRSIKRSKTDEKDDNSRCQLLSEENQRSDKRGMELIIEVCCALEMKPAYRRVGQIVLKWRTTSTHPKQLISKPASRFKVLFSKHLNNNSKHLNNNSNSEYRWNFYFKPGFSLQSDLPVHYKLINFALICKAREFQFVN